MATKKLPKRTLSLEYVPLDEIQRAPRNPKAHRDDLMRESMDEFGFLEPLVQDGRTGFLIGGHGRTDQLQQRRDAGEDPPAGISVDVSAGWLVPVVRGFVSKDDLHAERALIGLNRVGEQGGWITSELLASLTDLADLGLLAGTGFSRDEVTLLQKMNEAPLEAEAEPSPSGGKARVRTRRGDLWDVAGHRVMCGDCRNPDDVARLLGGNRVNLAFCSPPYAEQRDYDPDSGFVPVPPAEYVEWFAPVAQNVGAHLADDGSWFVNIKPSAEYLDTELYVFDLVLAHARDWGWHYGTEFCWERHGAPGRVALRFKNQFEPVYQFSRGEWKFRPENVRHLSEHVPTNETPGVTKTGRRKTKGGSSGNMANLQGTGTTAGLATELGLAYPGNRLPSFVGTHEATGHKAAFPVGLPAWFMAAYTDPGDVVFDPFLGSGSTVVAAMREGRVGYGMELSAKYVDQVLARLEAEAQTKATRISRGS